MISPVVCKLLGFFCHAQYRLFELCIKYTLKIYLDIYTLFLTLLGIRFIRALLIPVTRTHQSNICT